MQPVNIENEFLQMELWPQIGGKISSLVDKSDDYNILSNYPAELPTSSQYDIAFAKGWYAGWDECFPAIAQSRYAGHPYDGISVPDHGELWGIPTTGAIPTRNGITTVWQGLRFGYQFTRKLYLDGPQVYADYALINYAPFEFRYVWSMHALMSMESPAEIVLSAPEAFRLDHDHQGADLQQPFTWPKTAGGEDLSRPAQLPDHRGWKVFDTKPIAAPATVIYPQRKRQLTIEYLPVGEAPQAYWGIWINTGGKYRHRHFSIEPTTGRHDEIDRSIRDHSAGAVPPSGRCEWTVRWTIGPRL